MRPPAAWPSALTWNYSVYQDADGKQGPLVYSIDADLQGLTARPQNPSPLVEYGDVEHGGRRHVIANYWNFYGPFDTYLLEGEGSARISLGVGPAPDPHGFLDDLRALVGTRAPIAAQTFTSAPVASECRGTFPVPA